MRRVLCSDIHMPSSANFIVSTLNNTLISLITKACPALIQVIPLSPCPKPYNLLY